MGQVPATKWSVREPGTYSPAPIQNSECQADCPPSLSSSEPRTVVLQSSPPHQQAPDRAPLIYFSNTFSICPTFFSTLPVFFSALPSACKLGLFVTLPAVSLILPFTS